MFLRLSRPVFPCQRCARIRNETNDCERCEASLLLILLGLSADTGLDDMDCPRFPAGLGHSLKREHVSVTMECRYRGDLFRQTAEFSHA